MSAQLRGSAELQDFMLRCHGQIQELGCVTVTLPSDRRRRQPALAYTVGLNERFRYPELVLFGIQRDTALVVIGEIVRRYVRSRLGVPLDSPLPTIIGELSLVAKSASVERARPYARIAYARGEQIKLPCRFEQLVWPDANGHFPWESGYDRRYDRIQPQLFELQ